MPIAITPPASSAISNLISTHGAKTEPQSLPLEILHNLQYQHNWASLRLHTIVNNQLLDTTTTTTTFPTSSANQVCLISGLPPKHAYIHPDFQSHLLRTGIEEMDVAVQREYVLPMSLGEKYTLRNFSAVFDALPARSPMTLTSSTLKGREGEGEGEGKRELGIQWHDARRVLLGMLADNGRGGDGTVVYYIVQEGEVKPRQNG